MGHSQQHKAKNHDRIVAIAASQFRAHGLDGLSVAKLMAAAGLTHGGFYSHFATRDVLVEEAIDRAFEDAEHRLFSQLAGKRSDPLDVFLDVYLTPRHRDHPSDGCVLPALSTDIQRSASSARAVYTKRLKEYFRRLAALCDRPQDAMAILSTAVGAMLLARTVGDQALSKEILDNARAFLDERREARRRPRSRAPR